MSNPTIAETIKEPTAIRRVTYHQACPVSTCEHCSAAIKHVFTVHYRDGNKIALGSTCIERALSGDLSLKKLFKKNAQRLPIMYRYLEVLNMAPEDMPRGSEYFGSGLYFIGTGEGVPAPFGCASKSDLSVCSMADSSVQRKGEWVKVRVPAKFGGHWLFHPCPDVERNIANQRYVLDGRPTRDMRGIPGKGSYEPNTPENNRLQALHEVEKAKEYVAYEIARIEGFLARAIRATLTQPVTA